MTDKFRKGETVRWKWGEGYGEGKVAESFVDSVTRTIDGTEVTRNATADEPAYLVQQEGGDRVLKSHSELQSGTSSSSPDSS